MSDLQLFFSHRRQPEYLYVLLNPWPVYGMAGGAFILFLALVVRRLPEQCAALIWLTLMGMASWLAAEYGQRGYDRVYAMSNTEAQQWLKVHMDCAEYFAWVFYATGLVALSTLFTRQRWPAISLQLARLTVFLSLSSVVLGGWISHAGGQVRHSEFREGPPPSALLPSSKEEHSHTHGPGQAESAPAGQTPHREEGP